MTGLGLKPRKVGPRDHVWTPLLGACLLIAQDLETAQGGVGAVARSLSSPSSQGRTGARSRTETSVLILIGLRWGMLPAHTLP